VKVHVRRVGLARHRVGHAEVAPPAGRRAGVERKVHVSRPQLTGRRDHVGPVGALDAVDLHIAGAEQVGKFEGVIDGELHEPFNALAPRRSCHPEGA
jgi:hypothetical protein